MSKNNFVDFDVHGLVGIRLSNPTNSDTLALTRQLGPLRVPTLARPPDIIIRFEESLALPNLKYLGLNNAGFTDDGFFILKSKKTPAKVKIPFGDIGTTCEIVCESGLRAVPLLIAIVNLTLLKKDCIPLHASAFTHHNNGILVTGWSKGGKTESLLAFAKHGAGYVGDEWVILSRDGEHMFGLPEPITVWDWQLKQLPDLKKQLKSSDSLIFRSINMTNRLQRWLGKGRLRKTLPARLLREALPALNRQLHINIPPEDIFLNDSITLVSRPDKLFFVMSHEDPAITVEQWDSGDIARRMLHSVYYEQYPFFEYYQTFKFAFPEAQNDFLGNVREIQSDILTNALKNKEAYRVLHPYPVLLEDLYKAMEPYCRDATGSDAE